MSTVLTSDNNVSDYYLVCMRKDKSVQSEVNGTTDRLRPRTSQIKSSSDSAYLGKFLSIGGF